MTQAERKQNRRMRWVLFYVFVVIFVAIVTLTIMVVFFGFGDTTDQERSFLFKVFIGEVGIAVITLFKVLFGLKKKSKSGEEDELPRIGGKYKYEETGRDNKIAYLGECRIKQNGRILTFSGERKKESGKLRKKKVSVHWSSNWAELCKDNKVRLDYSLNFNGGIRGYAVLDAGKSSSKEIIGEFHLLHEPYDYGTMKLKRA